MQSLIIGMLLYSCCTRLIILTNENLKLLSQKGTVRAICSFKNSVTFRAE